MAGAIAGPLHPALDQACNGVATGIGIVVGMPSTDGPAPIAAAYRSEVSMPRTVSVLFTDIVASTELFAAMGDDAADAVRRDHVDGLRAIVSEHRGQVVKGLGDGIMAVFDSAAGAVEAGVAMQSCAAELATRRSLAFAIRVGVTAGDASSDGGDWFGTPVVEASRLCATAAPGQVLASELVRSLAGTRTRVAFHSLGPRALKGFPEVVHVHEVSVVLTGADDSVRGGARSSTSMPSRFRVIGQFSVESGGVPIADRQLGSRKARLLLKLLITARGRHVPMGVIIDALWPTAPPAKAVENVATLAARLRGALGSDTVDGGRSGYRLVIPPGCTLDVDDVERLVDEAERRMDAGQPALAATAAAHALELLGGGHPFEEETDEGEWLDDLRRELDRLLRRARVASWRASAGIGEFRRALVVADEAVAADPLDEEAHRAVMLAYHRLGEPGEALAAFERARSALVVELGTEPGPETQALYLAVLRGEPVDDEGRDGTNARGRGRLVGREVELAALTTCWSEATRGVASCVAVVGEAGIGKTRLVDELSGEVRSIGGIVAEARCYEAEESLFLQPIVEVLRALIATVPAEMIARAANGVTGPLAVLVPELSRVTGPYEHETTSPEMERRRTFEAIASFLAALSRRRPVLVILDDLQHASASTLELVHFVLRWDRSARLLVAVTAPDARELIVRLGASASAVELGPLPGAAVAELARRAGRPEVAGDLMALTRGHTLFVLEALRAVGGEDSELAIPETLRAAVTTRVASCGPDVDELLRAAVIAGAIFEVEHVAELLGWTGEEVVRRADIALRNHLIEESGVRYEFANDVIRKVLYESTPAPTRALRHRRLAQLLSKQPGAAAEHAAAGGEWEEAVDHWLAAARRAAAAFANVESDVLLTRALEACAVLGDPARTSRVQLQRGRARLALSRYDDAAEDLTSAQALARATGDVAMEAATLEELAYCAYHARQIERAFALAERAAGHAASGPGPSILMGRLQNARGDMAGAIENLEPFASAGGDAAVTGRALSYLGTALAHSDRFDDATEVLDRAATLCRAAGLLRPMFNALFFTGIVRGSAGDLVGALEMATQILVDVDRFENDEYRPRAHNLLSWLWRELGDPSRARDHAQEALETSLLPDGHVEGEPAAHARLQLAESALQLGDDAEAGRWLAELQEGGLEPVAFGWRIDLHRLDVQARLDPSCADELLEQARTFGSAKYQSLALAHLGRHDEAGALAEATGSDLLVAHVAPTVPAAAAVDRLVGRLRPELRSAFVRGGACTTARRR